MEELFGSAALARKRRVGLVAAFIPSVAALSYSQLEPIGRASVGSEKPGRQR
jgi:hypothetical protein